MSKKRNLKNESYFDLEIKKFFESHGKEILGFEVRINYEDPYGADLIAVHDPKIKVEVERSGAVYGFWIDIPLQPGEVSYQYKMGYPFKHVNMEIDRKGHYVQEYHLKFPEKPESATNPIVHNESYDSTIFVRTDFFFHQFVIVPNEVMRDPNKTLLCHKPVRNNSNPKPEHWASWRYEDTITINRLDNDRYVRETDDPTTHLPPISIEERKILEKERIRIKKEAKAKENEEKAKRAAEVYKNAKRKNNDL